MSTFRKVHEDTPVVEMTVTGRQEDIGAEESKKFPPGSRYRYAQRVVYLLDDGTQFETYLRALTKPKLQKRIDDQFRYIANREVFASQWQDGDSQPYWSTSWRVTIGLGCRS